MTGLKAVCLATLFATLVLVGGACSNSQDIEIKLAPIEEVNITFLESYPPQVSVYIKGGLPDGCTTFHDIETMQEGSTINIRVTTERPRDAFCPAVYTYFEKYVNLGSDFTTGTTYTLKVNDYTTTFTY